MSVIWSCIIVLISVIMLWKGADWLVESAAEIAHTLKVSDLIIGLTVVAFGTSAPEFAVTISAAVTQQTDISIGNVIGSNIFNILCVLGVTSIIEPLNSNWDEISFQVIIMICYGFLIFIASKLTQPINRIFSAMMLCGYILFIYVLF